QFLMANPVMITLFVILALSLTCNAANHIVGDTSGWDISTDLDTWAQDKRFVVGDSLVFQYSTSHSVDEVTKQDFDSCNTGNALKSYSNGNTTIPLTKAGTRYFVCGNQLHCLGGMKLQVNVESNGANSPVAAPEAQPGDNTVTNPSSKSNNPSSVVPTSSGFIYSERDSLVVAIPGLVAAILLMLQF
ncbi:hypothetical protein Tsubulata_039977, partial [Turnera subulata]